ncbi:hypothetical protein UY3_08118 [Chelonia mydas]|uniref:Uncharacterized protein n=1 Tax=Chelonia mydas TaxID=8469 RepID=M7BGF8_CHEMY|nr:hypothetical protein UY3_08118 [Chelonia mydas]
MRLLPVRLPGTGLPLVCVYSVSWVAECKRIAAGSAMYSALMELTISMQDSAPPLRRGRAMSRMELVQRNVSYGTPVPPSEIRTSST